ncbi:MAG: hypothetical protein MJ154_02060 [Candidatus Saccharibacteria bacterium]|nr:hypothetical protein [Candidatus Saccharibacteria bacterium]
MATQPVVDPVKMPSVKADNKVIATINAVSLTLATFMGWMTIFAAIASFTKKGWSVGIPFIDIILGANAGHLGYVFATGLLTVVFAVIGLITARKITDINAMKSSWKCVRNFFVLVACAEVFKMVALAIYALCGLGKKSGVDQGYLWLNGFLSNALAAAAAVAVVFVSNAIAAGKTQVLSLIRFIALGVASVALILAVVSMFVNFYGKKSSSSYDLEDALDSASSWLDYLK